MRTDFILPSFILALATAIAPLALAESPKADLSRLVVVGESLSAGFQNGSLLANQQVYGYASVVARQAEVPLPLPLIAAPGIPNVLTIVDPGPPPVIDSVPGISTGRVDPTVQPFNLAVPGANVADALHERPDPSVVDLTLLVLGLPGVFTETYRSQVEWAEALAPTTILVWLGSNDVLGAVVAADPAPITPVGEFETAYAEALERLAATGAAIAVANIPDPTVAPFLTSAAELAELLDVPIELLEPLAGIGPGDFVTPAAFELIGLANPLPDEVVLDASEVADVRGATQAFNAIIAHHALLNGAALVDIHALVNYIDVKGLVVGGQRLTTGFLGGLFSLDGIHPSNTGYAWIANEFIEILNRGFAAAVAKISLRQVQKLDPLVPPGAGHPATALRTVSHASSEALRATLNRHR